MIPFNQFYRAKNEMKFINEALSSKKISGNGNFTKKCHHFFENRYKFKKCLLTNSCTDALEMCAILLNIKPGDEVIVPSYTFVSTANAFVIFGAKIIFADSCSSHPNLDVKAVEAHISKKTKAIVAVHYAGFSCEMKSLRELCDKYGVILIEDAAQAIDNFYLTDNERLPLGSLGDLATFSFHETKNISSGEGGMLVVNSDKLIDRSEIIWEKGTNRSAFFRGEVNKYEWVDIGSSYLPSDLTAALLYSQLEELDYIQSRRIKSWQYYREKLSFLEEQNLLKRIKFPAYSELNAHAYFIVTNEKSQAESLKKYLNENDVNAVSHYVALHTCQYQKSNDSKMLNLPNAEHFSDNLIRLPLNIYLTDIDQNKIIDVIRNFFNS